MFVRSARAPSAACDTAVLKGPNQRLQLPEASPKSIRAADSRAVSEMNIGSYIGIEFWPLLKAFLRMNALWGYQKHLRELGWWSTVTLGCGGRVRAWLRSNSSGLHGTLLKLNRDPGRSPFKEDSNQERAGFSGSRSFPEWRSPVTRRPPRCSRK